MTEKEYRNHPAISRSELWKIFESPEKFKFYKDNPPEPKITLVFGILFHTLVLTPHLFDEQFILDDKNGKKTVVKTADDGRYYICSELMKKAEGMAKSVENNHIAQILLKGEKEVPYFWTDEDTGEDCKCRADAVSDIGKKHFIIDLKSTANAETEAFMRDAINFGYDFQVGMYKEGIDKCRGFEHEFAFICVEKEPPYSVNIVVADDYFKLRGKDLFRQAIGTYHECKATGNWWGYMGKENLMNDLTLPQWLLKEYQ